MKTITIEVCTDCAMAIAGYDNRETGSNDVEVANQGLIEKWYSDGWSLTNGKDHTDCEDHGNDDLDAVEYCEQPWFSWSSCDGCDSGLGGDRYFATAIKEE